MSLIRRTIPRIYGKALVGNSTQFEPVTEKQKSFIRETAKKMPNPIMENTKEKINPYGLPGTAREFLDDPFFPNSRMTLWAAKATKKPKKKRRTVCRKDPEKPTKDLWGKPLKAHRDIVPPCIDPFGMTVNRRRFRPIGTFRMYRSVSNQSKAYKNFVNNFNKRTITNQIPTCKPCNCKDNKDKRRRKPGEKKVKRLQPEKKKVMMAQPNKKRFRTIGSFQFGKLDEYD